MLQSTVDPNECIEICACQHSTDSDIKCHSKHSQCRVSSKVPTLHNFRGTIVLVFYVLPYFCNTATHWTPTLIIMNYYYMAKINKTDYIQSRSPFYCFPLPPLVAESCLGWEVGIGWPVSSLRNLRICRSILKMSSTFSYFYCFFLYLCMCV